MSAIPVIQRFFRTEGLGGFLLIACALFSLVIANSYWSGIYIAFWQSPVLGADLRHWINEGSTSFFFLLVGLELKREWLEGELSDRQVAILPIIGALGGMVAPAFIYLSFNVGTATQGGAGIPMATDIAFSLAVLTLVGKAVPNVLKVFLTSLAVVDDLGAVVIIAVFYPSHFDAGSFALAILTTGFLYGLNKLKVDSLIVYLLGGFVIWFFMSRSGVHATLSGIALSFVVPLNDDDRAPARRLEYLLQKPVAFLVLPLFALANIDIFINIMLIRTKIEI